MRGGESAGKDITLGKRRERESERGDEGRDGESGERRGKTKREIGTQSERDAPFPLADAGRFGAGSEGAGIAPPTVPLWWAGFKPLQL